MLRVLIISHFNLNLALAVIAGLFGAVLGSTYPVASVLVSAFAGGLTSAAIIAVCIGTLPHYIFGVRLQHCFVLIKPTNGRGHLLFSKFIGRVLLNFNFLCISIGKRILCGCWWRCDYICRYNIAMCQTNYNNIVEHCWVSYDHCVR